MRLLMNKKELRKLLLEQERVSEARSKRIDKLMREIDKLMRETAVFQMKLKRRDAALAEIRVWPKKSGDQDEKSSSRKIQTRGG